MRRRIPALFITLCLGLFSFFAHAQIGTVDSAFNKMGIGFGAAANDVIYALKLQSTGKMLIGGAFTSFNGVSRNGVAQLNADGTLDGSFAPISGANNTVYTLALQSDGKIVIGGAFTSYDGAVRNCIARLNADGTVDNSFQPVINDAVYTLALQSDGKIVIGGIFTLVNGTTQNHIARLKTDGTVDATFNSGSGVDNAVYSLAIQSTGKIVIGGSFSLYNGVSRNGIARLNASGLLDTTFDPGTGARGGNVNCVAIQSDGKVLIGGFFTTVNGIVRNYIARLGTTGALDAAFNPGTGATGGGVFSIAPLGDGRIVIGGYFTSYNGAMRNGLARLTSAGAVDATFYPGSGTNGGILSIDIQSDGKIVAGGEFTSYAGTGQNRITRINVTGPTLIVDALVASEFCANQVVSIPFTVVVPFATGNKFAAQLSDAFGSFVTPLTIGTLATTASGIIKATISAATVTGKGYRIRIVGSNPAVASFDNGTDLTINAIPAKPTVTANGPLTFCAGNSVTLTSSAATGNQWYKNSSVIQGATDQSYIAPTAGNYTVKVSDGGCASVASVITKVVVNTPPKATISYAGSPFCPTGTATPTFTGTTGGTYSSPSGLTVNATTGVVNLNAPASTYTINYTMPATGTCDAVTVSTTLIIRQPATITTQPAPQSICTGGSAKFSVVASGTGLTYQWRKDGADISGATAASYSFSSATLANAGKYAVQVKNTCGTAVSDPAVLTVTETTAITTQPVAIAACVGGKATFSIVASGSHLTYQWRKAKVDITNANSSTYTITNATTADAGSYDVIVTGDCGSKTSASVALTVSTPVSITAQPAAKEVCAGTSTSFTVTTAGTALSYQWRKGGSNIAGATSKTYAIASPTAADVGNYDVVVTSTCNSVTSTAVALKVNPVPATPVITATSLKLTSSATSGNQWLLNGSPISSATAKTYSPQKSGLYKVQVTQGSCSVTSEAYNFVYTRIEGPGAWNGAVSVSPNPVVNALVIRNPQSRKLYLQFFDNNGKRIYESELRSYQGTIDVQGWSSGVYYVLITDVIKKESILQTVVKL